MSRSDKFNTYLIINETPLLNNLFDIENLSKFVLKPTEIKDKFKSSNQFN